MSLAKIAGGSFAILGFVIGAYLDYRESLRMSLFRDKSALYGRPRKEGEEPSWPTTYL